MLNIVKNTTFPGLLDLLAPHSCRGCGCTGEALCKRCKNYIISNHINRCPNCKTLNPNGKCKKCASMPPTYVVSDRTELMGKLVHDFKYNSMRALSKPLAEILNEILPKIDSPVNIVPLPTIAKHVRERGLNHTLLIAKHLAKKRHFKVTPILVRNKNTVQVGANRKDRISQAESAYKIAKNVEIDPNTTYILLDDVWTTGASMKTAIKKLRQSGARKIVVAILAVSSDKS